MVPPYALLLFGGKLDVRHASNKIVIDGWMYFDAASVVGVVILELRRALEELLARKIERPEIDVSSGNSTIIHYYRRHYYRRHCYRRHCYRRRCYRHHLNLQVVDILDLMYCC